MAPHMGRTVLRLASAAPRLTTHSLHNVTTLRALTSSAQSAKKATPQVEATIPATTRKKASAKSELTIKVKAKTPTKAAATKKAPAKAAAAKSTTTAAKKPAAATKSAAATKKSAAAAKKPVAAKAKAATSTKLTAREKEKLQRQNAAEKAKAAREKEKAREAKRKEKQAEMKTKQRERAKTMRERKLEKAREVRRAKLERAREAKLVKDEREAARKQKRKEADKIKAQKQKVVKAKQARIQTIKDKKAEAQIGKIPTNRPLNMYNLYVQKSAVPGEPIINPGVLANYKNLTDAEKAALQSELIAINAERKEQYEKWKASRSADELKKMNSARTWLKTHLGVKAPRIKDPRCGTGVITPWIAFTTTRLKEDSSPKAEAMRQAAVAWKALSADEVQAYKQKADAMTKVKQAAMHL